MLVAETVSKASMATSTAASVAANQAIAVAAQPAAYFTSVATFGSAAVAGTAALQAGFATTRALSLTQRMATGGVVPENSNNVFVSGTDTVPALLTPGEAVIRRSAVHDNISLINKMNAGENVGGDSGKTVVINNEFIIQAIDSESIRDLAEKREFQESITDVINDQLLILKDKDGELIEAEM